jgi:hypothetical protein
LAFGQRRCQGLEPRGFGEYFFCARNSLRQLKARQGAKKLFAKILDIAAAQKPKSA